MFLNKNYAVDLNFLLDTLQQMQENGQKKTLQGGFTSEILSSYVFCPRKFMIHRRKSRKERIENEWEIVGGNTLKKRFNGRSISHLTSSFFL